MKKITFMIMLLFAGWNVNAQAVSKEKDSIIDLICIDVCNEIKSKDFSQMSKDDFEVQLGLAMIPAFNKHQSALTPLLGDAMESEGGMEKIGEMVGQRLVFKCPEFLQLMKKSQTANQPLKQINLQFIDAVLIAITPGEVTYLQIKDFNGKTENILWLDYFEGANELSATPKNFLNKKVAIKYSEKDVYNHQLKEYVKVKVAAGIQLL